MNYFYFLGWFKNYYILIIFISENYLSEEKVFVLRNMPNLQFLTMDFQYI